VTCDLFNIDAFQLLGSLADGAVDCVICDPPFDQRTHSGKRSNGETESKIDFPPFDAGCLRRFVREILRVSKRWVLAFCSGEQLGWYQQEAEEYYPGSWVRGGIWVKPDPAPQFTGDRPGQWGEAIAIMHREGKKRWNGGGHPARWTFGVCREDRCHPTQKPLDLMLELVRLFSDPDELVLDPFAGSGTTAVACLRSGRRFIGSEIDPRYHALALERIAAERSCSTLAQHRAGQLGLLGGE
jgi:site-specific DNA-methyltransferase (adenine-specific)